jgi:hypothetical protein
MLAKSAFPYIGAAHEDEDLPVVPPEQDPDVVGEAHHVLRRLRAVGAVSFVALIILLASVLLTVGLPVFFLIPIAAWAFVAFVAYEIFPLGQNASWARRVLKRWDDVRVDRAFDQIGAASDPRLEAAGAMAARIAADPAADRHTKSGVELVIRLSPGDFDD